MKKIILFLGVMMLIAVVFSTVSITFSAKTETLLKNVEALASNDIGLPKTQYRLRTVGCGSYNFADWITYCCAGYTTCTGGKSCSYTVYGCDGK